MSRDVDLTVPGQGGSARKAWVEPEVVELAIGSTAMFPRQRGDGGRFADCRRS